MVTRSKVLKQMDQPNTMSQLQYGTGVATQESDTEDNDMPNSKKPVAPSMLGGPGSVASMHGKGIKTLDRTLAEKPRRPVVKLQAAAGPPSAVSRVSPVGPLIGLPESAATYHQKLAGLAAKADDQGLTSKQAPSIPRPVRAPSAARVVSASQQQDASEVARLSKPLAGSVQKKVRFAPGHLNATICPNAAPDGHPATEGCVVLPVRHVPGSYAKDLTRGNVLMLEQMLGEDCNASISRLKRRVGLLPPIRAPRPFVNCKHIVSVAKAASGGSSTSIGSSAISAAPGVRRSSRLDAGAAKDQASGR